MKACPAMPLTLHYPAQARLLVQDLHRQAPDVRVLAWVYVGSDDGDPPSKASPPSPTTPPPLTNGAATGGYG